MTNLSPSRLVPVVVPLLLFIAFCLIAKFSPLPLDTDSDFRVLYFTNKALLNGIDIYDHVAKTEFVANETGIAADQVTAFNLFTYPPWYNLTTFYIGMFSIESAATLWFELNLAMLLFSVWLLTDGWKPKKRLAAFPLTLFFIPVFGTLIVGQYDLPVLLGAAVLYEAIKKEKPVLTALGMSLLTFKPHLGILLILAGLLHLVARRDLFGRQALKATLIAAVSLFITGFIADQSWLFNYLNSLINYRELGNVTTCSECANLSIWLSRWWTGELSLSLAAKIAAILFVASLAVMFLIKPQLWKFPGLFFNAAILLTLFASPYLYNYDYILLVFPFLWLAGSALNRFEWILLGAAIFLPAFALLRFGRDGNISFLILLAVTSVLLARHQPAMGTE